MKIFDIIQEKVSGMGLETIRFHTGDYSNRMLQDLVDHNGVGTPALLVEVDGAELNEDLGCITWSMRLHYIHSVSSDKIEANCHRYGFDLLQMLLGRLTWSGLGYEIHTNGPTRFLFHILDGNYRWFAPTYNGVEAHASITMPSDIV